MDDSRIIALYWQRDERAISESERRYGNYCFAVSRNIVENREDAEECVNTTWLRAWNAMPPDRPSRLKEYFGRIVRNLSLDCFRRKTSARRDTRMNVALEELEEVLSGTDTVEAAVDAAELQRVINDFLHRLPARECDIFLRRYFYVESFADIGRRYGMTENAVQVSLHRTREKLRAVLEKEELT